VKGLLFCYGWFIVCYEGFVIFYLEGLLFDMESFLSQFLDTLLSLLVGYLLQLSCDGLYLGKGYLLLFCQLWSIPWVYTLAKLSQSPYDRIQTLEV
jgi:hypothetical protein